MVPTQAGERYLAFARKLLEEQEEFERTIALERWDQRVLRIGIPFSRGELFVPALIAFEKAHPDIQVELLEQPFPEIEQRLDKCEIDMAFTNTPFNTNNWVVRELWQEEVRLYIPESLMQPAWKLKSEGPERWIDLEELSDCRFIIGSRDQLLGRMARQIFQENHFSPKRTFEIRNVAAMFQLATAGYGVCFCGQSHRRESWSLPREEIDRCLYSFGSHPYVNHFCAAYSKKIRDDSLLREFISYML